MDEKRTMRAWANGIGRAPWSAGVVAGLAAWKPLHGTVLSYLAMPDEVDLAGVHLLDQCDVVVTRTPVDGPLSIRTLVPHDLERHRLGYLQPRDDAPVVSSEDVDVVLVPGLAFDMAGNRLGRGKGYYDELLGRLPQATIRVGITVDELVVDEVPTEAHDVAVSWIATQSGVHRVGHEIHDATERFVQAAVAQGVAPDIHRFPSGTKTSQDAADAVGCELGAIAKSIVFEVDGEPVLVLASGDHRIDEARLAEAVGGQSARIAGLEAVRTITGFAAGGTPAVGLPASVRVVADTSLARYRWVWSAGGTPESVYPIALDRLVASSGARWVDVASKLGK